MQGEGHRQRLRDKFLAQGLDAFTDGEVIELLLTLGTPRSDCKAPAREALRQLGSLPAVLDAPAARLEKIRGIGPKNAFALGFILATAGTDPGDAAAAAFHLRTAAELGLVDAVVELLRRPNLVTAAGIDERGAARLLETAAIQAGQSAAVEDLYKRRNLNPMPAALLIKAFTDALAAGDWPGLIAAYKAIGERRAPLVDANMAYAVSSARGLDGPYDRLLVLADGGAAVMHPRSRGVIGWLCETGRAGLPKDLPNAALWTALALTGMKPDDALFAELSKRYAGLKDALPPGQRALVEQVAKDIGVQ